MKILNRWTLAVIFENEKETIKETVIDANLRGTDLSDADLRYADLRYADLSDADLSDADLRGTNLRGTNLRGTNLRGTDLSDANLRYADLRYADLSDADLRDADLRDAIGNMQELKTLLIETYSISFTRDILQIGCKRFTHQEWKNFNDEEINKMNRDALSFWTKWKEFIFAAIELSFEKGEINNG